MTECFESSPKAFETFFSSNEQTVQLKILLCNEEAVGK